MPIARSLRRHFHCATIAVISLLCLAVVPSAHGKETATEAPAVAAGARGIALPFMDARRGRQLFVGKGCVICHAVNGIGGKAAPALDATATEAYVNVFDFAARMWRGAATMYVLQQMELGYQVELTGEELAHLASFAADRAEQQRFSQDDIPELIQDWMADETYERLEELKEDLRNLVE